MTGSFLNEPPLSAQAQALYDEDLTEDGFVWNVSRLWAHQPDTVQGLFALMSGALPAERADLPPARDPGHRGGLGPR